MSRGMLDSRGRGVQQTSLCANDMCARASVLQHVDGLQLVPCEGCWRGTASNSSGMLWKGDPLDGCVVDSATTSMQAQACFMKLLTCLPSAV